MNARKLWTMALGLSPGTASAAGAALKGETLDCEHVRNMARDVGVTEPGAPASSVTQDCVLCVEQVAAWSARQTLVEVD